MRFKITHTIIASSLLPIRTASSKRRPEYPLEAADGVINLRLLVLA